MIHSQRLMRKLRMARGIGLDQPESAPGSARSAGDFTGCITARAARS